MFYHIIASYSDYRKQMGKIPYATPDGDEKVLLLHSQQVRPIHSLSPKSVFI